MRTNGPQVRVSATKIKKKRFFAAFFCIYAKYVVPLHAIYVEL